MEEIRHVGEKMIYLPNYGKMPIECLITRVTPNGNIYVNIVGKEKVRYKGGPNNYFESGTGKSSEVYLFTPGKWTELVEAYEQFKIKKAEEMEAREKRFKEFEESKRLELEELKAVVNTLGGLDAITTRTILPDESRLYQINLPVKPMYQEKKRFQIVIVHCKKNKYQYQDIDLVTSAATYLHGEDFGSFPSCSTRYGKDDVECIWDTLNSIYHSW